ncbi:hypothetical protein BS78_01G346900 [Paspalum vaginatum]|nr:hypothetical protein BS78_01G346900 [Paspalum vaginatum]
MEPFIWEYQRRGVYCAFSHGFHGLMIFLLTESSSSRGDMISINYYNYQDDYGGEYPNGSDGHNKEAVEDSGFEWSSDDDNVLDTEDMVEGRYDEYTSFLGFHPYREIVFLNISLSRAVAYHWNTSMSQDLGNIYPRDYCDIAGACEDIDRSFPYTPCWMEEFPENKLES